MSTLLKRLWVLGLAMAPACGTAGPARMTAPSHTTNITVNGTDLIYIGQSETFTAVGNGGAALTTARWGTDAPAVVTVESYTGRVTAVGMGTATVFADLDGVRGTKLVRTVPKFAGSWSGHYESCDERDCSPYDLMIGSVSMTLMQDRETVSGRASVSESPEAEVSGSVSAEGTLTFNGTFTLPAIPAIQRYQVVNIEFANVRFEMAQNGEMTGTFEMVSTTPGSSEKYRVYAKLRDMHRTESPWDY